MTSFANNRLTPDSTFFGSSIRRLRLQSRMRGVLPRALFEQLDMLVVVDAAFDRDALARVLPPSRLPAVCSLPAGYFNCDGLPAWAAACGATPSSCYTPPVPPPPIDAHLCADIARPGSSLNCDSMRIQNCDGLWACDVESCSAPLSTPTADERQSLNASLLDSCARIMGWPDCDVA